MSNILIRLKILLFEKLIHVMIKEIIVKKAKLNI